MVWVPARGLGVAEGAVEGVRGAPRPARGWAVLSGLLVLTFRRCYTGLGARQGGGAGPCSFTALSPGLHAQFSQLSMYVKPYLLDI